MATTNDPDVASLAAILTGASAYLNIMGSHTIINSFVSPAIFLGLSGVLELIQSSGGKADDSDSSGKSDNQVCCDLRQNSNVTDNTDSSTVESVGPTKQHLVTGQRVKSVLEMVSKRDVTKMDFVESNNNIKSKVPCHELQEARQYGETENNMDDVFCEERWRQGSQSGLDDHGYGSMPGSRNSSEGRSSTASIESKSRKNSERGKRNKKVSNKSTSSTASEELDTLNEICCKSQTATATFQHTSASDLTHRKKYVISDASNRYLKPQFFAQTMHLSGSCISGFLLAISVYIRPDATIFVCAILLSRCHQIRVVSLLKNPCTWCLILGAGFGLIAGAFNDFIFYDSFVLSPINWFCFNVWNNLASQLFGTSAVSFYIHRIFLGDLGMLLMLTVIFLAFTRKCIFKDVIASVNWPSVMAGYKTSDSNSENTKLKNEMSFWQDQPSTENLMQNTLCTVIVVAIYSYFGHKEERFLHDVVVLHIITAAEVVVQMSNVMFTSDLCNKMAATFQHTRDTCKKICRVSAFVLFVSLFLMTQTITFSNSARAETKSWMFSSSKSGQDTMKCLHFLSTQSDVTGVYIEGNFQDGGYTVLHKNVPLIYLLGSVFLEFTNASAYRQKKHCVVSYKDNMGSVLDHNFTAYSDRLSKCHKGYYSITTVSDLVHKNNTKAVLRKLVGVPDAPHHFNDDLNSPQQLQPRYNYAIIKAEKQFLDPGFQVVTQTKTMWIWRRTGDPRAEAKLLHIAGYRNHVTLSKARVREPTAVDDADQTVTNSNKNHRGTPADTNQTIKNLNTNYSAWSKVEEDTEPPKRNLSKHTLCVDKTTCNMTSSKNVRALFGNISSGAPVSLAASKNLTPTINSISKAPTPIQFSNQKNNKTSLETGKIQAFSGPETNSDGNKLPRNAHFLEYEGEVLKQMGNYWQAYTRFNTLISETRVQAVPGKIHTKASILASAAYCLYRMGDIRQWQQLLAWCMTSYSRDQCLAGDTVMVTDLADRT